MAEKTKNKKEKDFMQEASEDVKDAYKDVKKVITTSRGSFHGKAYASTAERALACIVDLLFTIIPVLGIIYFIIRDALPFLNGQSIGKKLFKIRVLDENGENTSNNWIAVLIRNIILIIPFLTIIELIVMLVDKEGKRLGDKWSKSYVVKDI